MAVWVLQRDQVLPGARQSLLPGVKRRNAIYFSRRPRRGYNPFEHLNLFLSELRDA